MRIATTCLPLDLSVVRRSGAWPAELGRGLRRAEELHLTVRLSATEPLRVAVMIYKGGELSWGLHSTPAWDSVEVVAKVSLLEWTWGHAVRARFERRVATVEDRQLKHGRREHVCVTLPAVAATGQLIPVCEVQPHRLRLAILALAVQDTEKRRKGRWRIRPRLAECLAPELRQLASGAQSGVAMFAQR